MPIHFMTVYAPKFNLASVWLEVTFYSHLETLWFKIKRYLGVMKRFPFLRITINKKDRNKTFLFLRVSEEVFYLAKKTQRKSSYHSKKETARIPDWNEKKKAYRRFLISAQTSTPTLSCSPVAGLFPWLASSLPHPITNRNNSFAEPLDHSSFKQNIEAEPEPPYTQKESTPTTQDKYTKAKVSCMA